MVYANNLDKSLISKVFTKTSLKLLEQAYKTQNIRTEADKASFLFKTNVAVITNCLSEKRMINFRCLDTRQIVLGSYKDIRLPLVREIPYSLKELLNTPLDDLKKG